MIERIIWTELVYSAYWEQYISQYVSHKYDWRKIYNSILLILSTIGASSFKIWELIPNGEQWIPIILLSIMSLVQLLSILQNSIVDSDDTIKKLIELRIKYLSYLDKIESLYVGIIANDKIVNDDIKKKFYEIRKEKYHIEDLKDSLNIKKLKLPNKKAQQEMETRLARKYKL